MLISGAFQRIDELQLHGLDIGRIEETGWRLPQQGFRLPATNFVANAHKAGLKVHLWAVPAENVELPLDYRRGDPKAPGYAAMQGDATGLARRLFAAGIDGAFTDNPDLVAAALR